MIDITTFNNCLAQPNARGYDLDERQKEAVEYGDGPLWIIAGPGSGKSEVLVTRTLKLLCVDGISPRSIFVTTFTQKAARNLEDRLATYLTALQEMDSSLKEVDIADIRIGTLHSLCNDILQEYRYPYYQNVRLLDQVEQDLFTYQFAAITKHEDISFWQNFEYAVTDWRSKEYPPSKWKRTKAAVTLFNRLVEDRVDIQKMLNTGNEWEILAQFYQQYSQVLQEKYRCDFAHLQARFLEFLQAPASQQFLEGDDQNQSPLLYVLVDEYQDTNPIQEKIYISLVSKSPHNITVVGDDDQALYRFRGGNVSCMVNFNKACMTVLNQRPHQVQLDNNYRSHPDIVDFFNHYIFSFSEMNQSGVRAPNKTKINARSSISGDYPAVSWITDKKVGDLPNLVAKFITEHLIGDRVISDLSQCVLLLRSAKDSPRNAGKYIEAFQNRGIPIYNPRSKSFIESEEVQCLLAALVQIIDRKYTFRQNSSQWSSIVQSWLDTLDQVQQNPDIDTSSLEKYLNESNIKLPKICADSIKLNNSGRFLKLNLLEILYRILSREPFQTWRKEPERNLRLSKLTRLFEGYHSFNLDILRTNFNRTDLDDNFRYKFYQMFVKYLIEYGINEDEDEDEIVPQGYLPIMTIHQAKGLEFPFVFVGDLGKKGRIGAAQKLEETLIPFRQDIYNRKTRSPQNLVVEDDIRLLYVAYSRAQYGLLLVGTRKHIKDNVAAPKRDATAFKRNTTALTI